MPTLAMRAYPYDNQAGTPQSVAEDDWRDMARFWVHPGSRSGVIVGEDNELAVTGASDGMIVHVNTGKAAVRGNFGRLTAAGTLTVPANASGVTRVDRAMLTNDFAGNAMGVDYVLGSGSTPPAPTQTSTGWQVPLARIAVPNGAGSITPGMVTDERPYVGGDAKRIGELLWWPLGTVPDSTYLAVIGQLVSRVTYADLFALLGTTYGAGDGSTTFGLPAAAGRTLVAAGAGIGLTARTAGQTFGEELHALIVAEMASHDHGSATGNDFPAHVHNLALTYFLGALAGGGAHGLFLPGDGAPTSLTTSGPTGGHQHTLTAQGGGGGHNNLQPSLVAGLYIKAR